MKIELLHDTDPEKLRAFAQNLREFVQSFRAMSFDTPEAAAAFVAATEQLDDTIVALEAFAPDPS